MSSILLEASRLMLKAKGCKIYLVSMDVKDEDCIWITEVWDSKEDHDKSLKLEGVRELISRAMPVLVCHPENGQELNVMGRI